jgi:hypothetical protein
MFTHTMTRPSHQGCSRNEWSALSYLAIDAASACDVIVVTPRGNRTRDLPG